MEKEIEIRLLNINKEQFVKNIIDLGAKKLSEALQKRGSAGIYNKTLHARKCQHGDYF